MAKGQSAELDRKKLMADPIMMTTIVLLVTFLTLFILYPLAILLVDSLYGSNGFSLDTFKRIFGMWTFRQAITNTLKVGLVVGILSTLIGLLFARPMLKWMGSPDEVIGLSSLYVTIFFSGSIFGAASTLFTCVPPDASDKRIRNVFIG